MRVRAAEWDTVGARDRELVNSSESEIVLDALGDWEYVEDAVLVDEHVLVGVVVTVVVPLLVKTALAVSTTASVYVRVDEALSLRDASFVKVPEKEYENEILRDEEREGANVVEAL